MTRPNPGYSGCLPLLVTFLVAAATPLQARAQARPAADPGELSRSIDALVEAEMERFRLPGAAVVVVHDGEVVHARGYGYADLEAGRLFDSRTVFRTASVSKLFTATAVMQLVEQGLVDLDEDVGAYLDIPVPARFDAPITMRHLLTHTAGFDERLLGTSASKRRPADVIPVREFLTSRDAAPRVRPPGTVISYSNHGMALAGYVVERLSGRSFEDYVDDHIHRPLGMTRSTFRDPLPDHLAADRARAYVLYRGAHEALPITFENAGPAGSQFSTADDIARFMLANLDGGLLDGARILEPETLADLHATAFSHHPLLPGWTLGFVEYHWNGRRLVGHGGDIPGYHNQLSLVPDARLGVFVHFNGAWPVSLDDDPRMNIVDGVLAALLPALEADAPPPQAITPDDARVAGNYRLTRHASTSMEKLLLPASFARLHVRQNDDGTLRVTMPLGFTAPSQWAPVGPGLYRRLEGTDYLAFRISPQGTATHLFGTLMIPLAFERVRWFEGEVTLLALLGFSAAMFFGFTLAWPARAALRRVRPAPRPETLPDRRRAVFLARAVALLGSAVVLTLGVMIVQAITLGDTPLLRLQPLLAALAAACGLLALALAYATLRSWRAGTGPRTERLVHTALALAGILFLWQMSYWNVLGV